MAKKEIKHKQERQSEASSSMRYLAMVSAIVLSLAAFLSWGVVSSESVVGTQGDGRITMFLGIAALLFLLKRSIPLYIPTILGLLALGVSAWDYVSISKVMLTINGQIGLGLYLTLAASFLLALGSFIQWLSASEAKC